MYSNLKQQAIEYAKQAVQEDSAGNYAKAFPLYRNALEYFKTHLKYEKNPKIKEAIQVKCTEYLRRAEEIRIILEAGSTGPGASSGDDSVATQPMPSKLKEKDVHGAKQSTLRAELKVNSIIVTEKPNNMCNDVASLIKSNENAYPSSDQAAPVAKEAPFRMHSYFKEQAIEYVKQAVQEDNAGNYSRAFTLYMNALEYFKTHLKYDKNPKMREAITAKFTEYLRRAEEIRAFLDGGGAGRGANSGDAL
ncbi:hypothetical protein PR202_ga27761 [Eleusine coracana subsp. coracana]|uniref:MIT domain-containing protein n=1 Tax=Eleusine coracana subsp. coracana TaxID=191504 RepID=A0AAV5DIF9_ELECO|nr:hypothetical protein PR202_ga27761 [Eleusine coracana subsp. coracana]